MALSLICAVLYVSQATQDLLQPDAPSGRLCIADRGKGSIEAGATALGDGIMTSQQHYGHLLGWQLFCLCAAAFAILSTPEMVLRSPCSLTRGKPGQATQPTSGSVLHDIIQWHRQD